jgi:hypothetical protein
MYIKGCVIGFLPVIYQIKKKITGIIFALVYTWIIFARQLMMKKPINRFNFVNFQEKLSMTVLFKWQRSEV